MHTAGDRRHPASFAGDSSRPGSGSPDALPAARYTDFPCSLAQERFWLLDRLEPGNPAYNVAVRWRLQGRVSRDLLEQAWQQIIERHEILRTVFLEVEGRPVQRVVADAPFRLTEIDLTPLAAEAQVAEGEHIGLLEARAPFDLLDGPLLRVVLLRYAATESVILVTTHQIVSDGWSIGVMAREMGIIYAALSRQEAPPLEPLAIQYGDYALWQLEWLRQRGTAAETAYWTRQLAGVPPFEVLADRPRPAVPTTNGAIVSIVLPRELTARMHTFGADRGVTMYAMAVCGMCAALGRFTGKDEVVLGTQVSDRDQIELEPMIGQFVNSLILRNDLHGNPTFSVLLERVSGTIAEALEHRHIPIESLLDLVKAGRGGGSSPAVSVNFIFQRTFVEGRSYGDFTLVDLPSQVAGAIYDLNFFMVERPDGWRFSCQFNTDQFEADTALRLLRYVADALAGALQDPERPICELRLGDAAELARLSPAAGPPALADPRTTVADQFARQCRLTPHALAVIHGERRYTYAQLQAAARRLAADLKSVGVGPGKRVAIGLDPSIERTAAILATVLLGAAYVSVDADDPPQFVQRLLNIAGAQFAFLEPTAAQGIITPARVMTGLEIDPQDGAPPVAAEIAPDGEAAVLFAARNPLCPDAVTLSQSGLMNLCASLAQRLGIGPDGVVAVLCRNTPEPGPLDSLLPLLCGACSVIPTRDEVSDAGRAAQLISRTRASVVYADGPAWSQLLSALGPGQRIAKALCRRDAVDPAIAARLIGRTQELWALHGYPQTGGCTSARLIRQPSDLRNLGQPLHDTQLCVLDRHMRVPPIGALGELYACRPGVGPDAAASPGSGSFVAMAADGTQDRTVFRTGDAVRRRGDGSIEIVDDATRHFTVGGRTFATAALVSAVLTYPQVAEAAVIARPAADDLTLYLTWQPGVDPRTGTDIIRSNLAAAWPRAAQPRGIVTVESLPHAADGSIDLRRLERAPGATAQAPADEGDPQVPQGLAQIWIDLLKIERIDPDANFFELGGHSLLAARMLTRVEAQFGRRVTLAALFRLPTLRGLSRLLRSDSREYDFRQIVKLQAGGSRPPLIAINNTGAYYLLAKRLGPDQPVISLQLFDPATARSDLPDTLEAVAAEYVRLIRRVHPSGPLSLMGWCVAGTLAFEVARQLAAAKRPVASLFLVDSWAPGYFQQLPLLRRLIGTSSLKWQLLADDWRSWRIGHLSRSEFLARRLTLQRLLRLLRGSSSGPKSAGSRQVDASESHDRWLLDYLQVRTARYEPRPYSGHVSIIRSTREPTGWLFDPYAGWGPFAAGGIDLTMVEGNHFTMLQDPGVTQMALAMAERLRAGATGERPALMSPA
jgi:non-ribosomal peptide synthetase component F/thioesterase domain-containing protein/acyl carrier protein